MLSALVAAALAGAGCRSGPLWVLPNEARVSELAIAAALDDQRGPRPASFDPALLPPLPAPRRVRPCCPFGKDLHVTAGSVPVPGFEMSNLREVRDLGPHRYDGGSVTIATGSGDGLVARERNGLVFTCRGGFIDTAHVRDNADLALYLSYEVARRLARGGEIPLLAQGGEMRVRLRPAPPEWIAEHGTLALAADLAAWLTYQVSIWHELATWYGYESFAGWSEKPSAFSPEDFYSNALGIKIARALVRNELAPDERSYSRQMEGWLAGALERIGATSLPTSEQVMDSLDGAWWDSARRLPDWKLLRRRNFDTRRLVVPWTAQLARPPFAAGAFPAACARHGPPLPLLLPEGAGGVPFSRIATLEIDVDPKLVEDGLALRTPGDPRVTQRDFERLVAAARDAHLREFGPGSDRPEP